VATQPMGSVSLYSFGSAYFFINLVSSMHLGDGNLFWWVWRIWRGRVHDDHEVDIFAQKFREVSELLW